MTTLFLDLVKQKQQQQQKLVKSVLTIRTITNDSQLVQLFGLWGSWFWPTVAKSKGGVADPLPKYLLLCNVSKSMKKAVADPTWVQSTIATRYGMF